MRSVHSAYTTGPQAIALAAVAWWLSANREHVLAWVRRQPKEAFCHPALGVPKRTPSGIGHHVLALWPELPALVWDELRANEGVCYMLDHGAADPEDFAAIVGTACAEVILAAGEFERFDKPIWRYRQSRKPPRAPRRD